MLNNHNKKHTKMPTTTTTTDATTTIELSQFISYCQANGLPTESCQENEEGFYVFLPFTFKPSQDQKDSFSQHFETKKGGRANWLRLSKKDVFNNLITENFFSTETFPINY